MVVVAAVAVATAAGRAVTEIASMTMQAPVQQ